MLGVANNLQLRLQIVPAKRENRTGVDWRAG
jgi:hypothetical protein